MKISKQYIVIFIISLLIFLMYILANIKNNNILNNQSSNLDLQIPSLIKKQECNITFLSKNEIFSNKKTSKINLIKKHLIKNKKDIYIKNNILYIYNKKYIYLGDLIKKNNYYAIFKINEHNLSNFIYLSIYGKLANKLTLIKNTNQYLLFKDKNNTFILKKNYIDITKYKKDKNETKN